MWTEQELNEYARCEFIKTRMNGLLIKDYREIDRIDGEGIMIEYVDSTTKEIKTRYFKEESFQDFKLQLGDIEDLLLIKSGQKPKDSYLSREDLIKVGDMFCDYYEEDLEAWQYIKVKDEVKVKFTYYSGDERILSKDEIRKRLNR